jgi:putative ABC transport system substrate-binding protein
MLFEYTMGGKWLELLKEIAPNLTRMAILRDPANPSQAAQFGAMRAVAPAVRVEIIPVNVRDAGEIERGVTDFARTGDGGLIPTSGALALAASRSDHRACGQAQAAGDLLGAFLRHQWRPDVVRA